MVPRTWDRQVHAEWAVVWLPGPKAEVEKQALLVSEHAGCASPPSRRSINSHGQVPLGPKRLPLRQCTRLGQCQRVPVWLLGAACPPPALSASFNGQRVLVSPIELRAAEWKTPRRGPWPVRPCQGGASNLVHHFQGYELRAMMTVSVSCEVDLLTLV